MRQHYLTALAEFHTAFGVTPYARLPRVERLALLALRSTLIEEETRELFEALSDVHSAPSDENRVHLAKETADLLYVTVGAAQLLSLNVVDPAAVFQAYQPFFSVTELRHVSREAEADLDAVFRMLDRDYPNEDIADAVDDLAPRFQAVVDMLHTFAESYLIPLREVFDAVHASNMSKLDPETRQPLRREDGKILKGPWYQEPDIQQVMRSAAA